MPHHPETFIATLISWLLLLLPRVAYGDTASSLASTDLTSAKPSSLIFVNSLPTMGLPCSTIKEWREATPSPPALTQAIRESRISIVVFTKNCASSSWCLDELLGILKCREEMGQIVMTIFYGIDPSHVRKQTGDFRKVFKETCLGKTEEERQRWSQALTDVGNIAGEHFLNWDKESEMIEKIARDVSNKLNATVSTDFEDMVGIEAHLDKIQS